LGSIYAANYGGVAAIVRSVTTKYDNAPHTGAMYYVDSLPKVPGVAIGYQDADYLSEMMKKDPSLRVTLNWTAKLIPILFHIIL
jgi:carboxypeptidase Q